MEPVLCAKVPYTFMFLLPFGLADVFFPGFGFSPLSSVTLVVWYLRSALIFPFFVRMSRRELFMSLQGILSDLRDSVNSLTCRM